MVENRYISSPEMNHCRKPTLLILGLFISAAALAQKGKDTLYSSNGDTMIVRAYLKNGKPDMEYIYVRDSLVGFNHWFYLKDGHGFSKGLEWRLRGNSIIVTRDSVWEYHPNGELKIVGMQINGHHHGRMLTYFSSGQQQCDCQYLNGKRDGIQQVYDEAGWIAMSCQYMDGLLHGTYSVYYPTGQLRQELIFRDGKPWDAIAAFDPDGHPISPGTLKDGHGTRYVYDDAGQLMGIKTYRNGKLRRNSERLMSNR